MAEIYLRPSKKLQALIEIHPSRNHFAAAFDLPYTTFVDWLDGDGSLPGNLVAQIVERTRLNYHELFVHSTVKPRSAAKR